MANDYRIRREPLLDFIADLGLVDSNSIIREIEERGIGGPEHEDGDRLNDYLSKLSLQMPEGQFLTWLLTHRPFIDANYYTGTATAVFRPTIASEAYVPAPGLKDAINLTPEPSTDDYAAFPKAFRRSSAWLVTSPKPSLVILTYDPQSLSMLPQSRSYWINQAAARRRDLLTHVSDPANQHFGLTSAHQFFHASERWRQMPVAAGFREICEQFALDPYFATELALYCWNDGVPERTLRELQQLADLTERRIIYRPRLYPSSLPERLNPPAPPEVTLLNTAHNFWRKYFVELIENSAAHGDSDIHLLPKHCGGYTIKRRRDGYVQSIGSIPSSSEADYLVASLAGSRIELSKQRALPKDGRATITLPTAHRTIDLRINTQPGVPPFDRPSVVIRLLDNDTVRGGLNQVLLTQTDKDAWDYALRCTQGMILVTGPTGSGKSRTLYAFLQTLHRRHPGRSYKSIEDPVELMIGDWLVQNSIDSAAGSSTSLLLRSMMRADPEVIFIGEIRDEETARIAASAARSGHLTIASLHAPEPAFVPARLRDFGLLPSDIKSLLRFITVQSLLGRSCPICRGSQAMPAPMRALFTQPPSSDIVTTNRGCPQCFDRGVRGRFASQEYLICPEEDAEMQEALGSGDPTRIRSLQRARGFMGLKERGLSFACGENALTNVREVFES